MYDPIFQALAEAARTSEQVALGIISRVKGSSPQAAGAKAVFYPDGRIRGTLGGGCLEAEIQKRALQSLRNGQPDQFDLLLDHDFGWDDGLVCGGRVSGLILPRTQAAGASFWEKLAARDKSLTWGVRDNFTIAFQSTGPDKACDSLPDDRDWLYQETVTPPCALWIAGAGHVAQAVAPLALRLDFAVTVLDDRPALVSREYFPSEVDLRADVWDRLLSLSIPAVPTFGLIVTRGHRHDALVLREWIRQPFVFLGMIGSARKARTIATHFVAEELATPEALSRVACPVGIDIYCRTVHEIAVSILAQYIDKRAELVHGHRQENRPAVAVKNSFADALRQTP